MQREYDELPVSEMAQLKAALELIRSFPEQELMKTMSKYTEQFEKYTATKEYREVKHGLAKELAGVLATNVDTVNGPVTFAEIREALIHYTTFLDASSSSEEQTRSSEQSTKAGKFLQGIGYYDREGADGVIKKADNKLLKKVTNLQDKYSELQGNLDSLNKATLSTVITNQFLTNTPKGLQSGGDPETVIARKTDALKTVHQEGKKNLKKKPTQAGKQKKVAFMLDQLKANATIKCSEVLLTAFKSKDAIADIKETQTKARLSRKIQSEVTEQEPRKTTAETYRENQHNINRRDDSADAAGKLVELYKQHVKLVGKMLVEKGQSGAFVEVSQTVVAQQNDAMLERVSKLQENLRTKISSIESANENETDPLARRRRGEDIRKTENAIEVYEGLRDKLQDLNSELQVGLQSSSTATAPLNAGQQTNADAEVQSTQTSRLAKAKTHVPRKSLGSGEWEAVKISAVAPQSQSRHRLSSRQVLASSTESSTETSSASNAPKDSGATSGATNWKSATMKANQEGPRQGWVVSRTAANAAKVATAEVKEGAGSDNNDSFKGSRPRSPSFSSGK